MKSKQQILETLRRARPELEREFGITRLALFGSYAYGEATERSDVDVLVDFDPRLGLRFVDLANQIEAPLGMPADVISRRSIPRSAGQRLNESSKMSRRPAGALLTDRLERIGHIERHVAGPDRAGFLSDEKTSDSVVRNLEVIGEAASRLPLAFRQRHAQVPWPRIIGLRHRVVHAYFDVDLELVWEIVCHELPRLKGELESLLKRLGDEDSPTSVPAY